MKWSYSKSKTFRRCQRQWFYANCVASGTAKDPLRRKVYLLGKLQTIAGWRGSIVDRVIETDVVPLLQRRRYPDPEALVARARRLYDLQLATALEHPLKQPDRSVKSFGEAYAAFHCVEYSEPPSDAELDAAWSEIETALRNLCSMGGLLKRLSGAGRLIAQRPLSFERFGGVNVVAVPDLIAFYPDEPPAIIDWKAHAVGTMDASTQLGIYSIALAGTEPHKDFPTSVKWPVGDIRLVEVQLLLNRTRRHELDDADRASIEAYIAESSNSMLMATGGRTGADLDVADFPTASYDRVCERCSFRKACWETLQ